MYKILSPAFFIITVILSCSNPTIVKQQTIGGNEDDVLRSMCVTTDGGFIICGSSYSDSSNEKTSNNHGVIYSDLWIIKFNRTGKMLWQKTIGGNSIEIYGAIAATDDGGAVIGGISASGISGDKTDTSRGSTDIWVVKLDSVGNLQWDKTIGGSGSDICHVIRQTADKGFIIGGASNSNISGDKTENCRGDFDMWIVKLDSIGNIQWDKTLGGNKWEFPGGLELADNGSVIICGNSASDICTDKSEGNRGKRADYWIIKLDKNGKKIWDRTIGGNDDDMAFAIKKTGDGNYLVDGFSSSDKGYEKSENCRGGIDIWVVKIDSTGKKIWDRTIGGDGDDAPAMDDILLTQDNNYLIGGYSNSKISGDKTDRCRGDLDYWILMLDKDGKIKWSKTIGGSGHDDLVGFAEIEKNHFVLAGNSGSNVSGDKTDSSRGKNDYWIVYLNE